MRTHVAPFHVKIAHRIDYCACAPLCVYMYVQQFFICVYVVEAVLKLIALGPIQYFRDKWNTFDFIVTALGVIELGLEGVQGLSVLRSMRLVSGSMIVFQFGM